MYKEYCKKQPPSLLEWFIVGGGTFGILFIINYIGVKFAYQFKLYSDFLTIVIFSIIGYWVIRRYVLSYKYMVIGEEFIIQQIMGSKEKLLLNINLNQIEVIDKNISESYEEDKKKTFVKRQKLYNNWKSPRVYYCIYEENEEKYFFEFEPSDKMLGIMMNRKTKISNIL